MTYSSEGTAHQRGAKEGTHALLELVPLVVHGSQVDDAGHDTSLEDTQQEPKRYERTVAVDEAHAHIDDTPAEHETSEVEAYGVSPS